MSPRSRRSSAIASPADRLQLKIFAEGEKTETAYLNHWNRLYREYVVISMARHTHTTPFELVQAAASQRRQDLRAGHDAQRRAKEHLQCGKDLTSTALDRLVENFDQAKTRAQALGAKHDADGSRQPWNPHSELWKLVDGGQGQGALSQVVPSLRLPAVRTLSRRARSRAGPRTAACRAVPGRIAL